ncbi:MAG: alpha/beta hydrolase [Phycisphaerales bacterium]|jgi:pimeloyl-ACP methyl ester carboxylesterase|nr:alpha/beta hydrolase [Phycisphaerales bacterium]
MANLAILLAFGGVAYWALLVVMTARTLSRPPRYTAGAAIARGRPSDPGELDEPRAFTSWTLRSRGMELPVWDIPGDDPRGPVVVMTHGWSDSRLGALPRLQGVLACASRIIAWDMPGHGDAPGSCDLGATEWIDLCALLDRIADTEPPNEPKPAQTESSAPHDVVLFGWSLGAGVSLRAAVEWNNLRASISPGENPPRVAGVICEAPYRVPHTPASRVLRLRRMPWRVNLKPALWLVHARTDGLRRIASQPPQSPARGLPPAHGFHDFDRAAWAERFAHAGGRVLVIHGTNDPVCPPGDGREITRAAGERGTMVEIEGASHNDLWTDERFAPRCRDALVGFVRGLARDAYDSP